MREFLALGFRYSLSEDFVVTGVAGAAGGGAAGKKIVSHVKPAQFLILKAFQFCVIFLTLTSGAFLF